MFHFYRISLFLFLALPFYIIALELHVLLAALNFDHTKGRLWHWWAMSCISHQNRMFENGLRTFFYFKVWIHPNCKTYFLTFAAFTPVVWIIQEKKKAYSWGSPSWASLVEMSASYVRNDNGQMQTGWERGVLLCYRGFSYCVVTTYAQHTTVLTLIN